MLLGYLLFGAQKNADFGVCINPSNTFGYSGSSTCQQNISPYVCTSRTHREYFLLPDAGYTSNTFPAVPLLKWKLLKKERSLDEYSVYKRHSIILDERFQQKRNYKQTNSRHFENSFGGSGKEPICLYPLDGTAEDWSSSMAGRGGHLLQNSMQPGEGWHRTVEKEGDTSQTPISV